MLPKVCDTKLQVYCTMFETKFFVSITIEKLLKIFYHMVRRYIDFIRNKIKTHVKFFGK